jgi:hypothetical protein
VLPVLLDPSKRAEKWLADLRREAAASYGPSRAEDIHAALERLSRALAFVATAGAAVDPRTLDATESESAPGERRG